jgi:site-specific DNA-methyltransferase (adenine-specific)
MDRIVFSSNKNDWETPDHLFQELNIEFGFTLDAAANRYNHKCDDYFTPDNDALSKDWNGRVWLNPPYGRYNTGIWMKKAWEEAQTNAEIVVCLVPSRTDTKWFHDYVWDVKKNTWKDGVEGRFIKGRLKFKGAKDSAPFPSLVVIFKLK